MEFVYGHLAKLCRGGEWEEQGSMYICECICCLDTVEERKCHINLKWSKVEVSN